MPPRERMLYPDGQGAVGGSRKDQIGGARHTKRGNTAKNIPYSDFYKGIFQVRRIVFIIHLFIKCELPNMAVLGFFTEVCKKKKERKNKNKWT